MLIDLIATCPEGTKETVADELASLGATNIELGYMAVHFSASERDFYRIHLKCSTASQIMKVLRVGSSKDSRVLFSQARRVDWTEVFTTNQTYRVDAVAGDRGPEAMTSNDISKAVRMAIEDVFAYKLELKPRVDLKEPDVIVVAYVYQGRVTLSVLTSGMTLHKRGYRLDGHPAPLKETLAAAILKLSGYDGTQALLDPMCGSGTLVIEGCTAALDKGSNIHRKKGVFSFEHLKSFNRTAWRDIQDEVRLEKKEQPAAPIFASDIDETFVDMAQKNALRARVEKHISFQTKSFFDIDKPAETGLIVTNLPYGERLNAGGQDVATSDLGEFYNAVGDKLKQSFTGWSAAILCAEESPWKAIRLRPTARIQLLNGSIKTRLLLFDIRAGTFHQ
jgi:putative N6-adenine-specific DNA methylase